MHEYSIVQSLIATCARVAREHAVERIVKVHITVGKMSGVDPHFLETAYRFFREETVCEHAELAVDIEEIEARCEECTNTFPVKDLCFVCPACTSQQVLVTKGKTLLVTHIEAQ